MTGDETAVWRRLLEFLDANGVVMTYDGSGGGFWKFAVDLGQREGMMHFSEMYATPAAAAFGRFGEAGVDSQYSVADELVDLVEWYHAQGRTSPATAVLEGVSASLSPVRGAKSWEELSLRLAAAGY